MYKLWCIYLKDNFIVIENSVLEVFLVILKNVYIGIIGKVIKIIFNISYVYIVSMWEWLKGYFRVLIEVICVDSMVFF